MKKAIMVAAAVLMAVFGVGMVANFASAQAPTHSTVDSHVEGRKWLASPDAFELPATAPIATGVLVSRTATGCTATRMGQRGYDGQYLQTSYRCNYGRQFQDTYQAWALCWDGYGGQRYQYGLTRVVGSGYPSITSPCYNGAYGAQMPVGGGTHS